MDRSDRHAYSMGDEYDATAEAAAGAQKRALLYDSILRFDCLPRAFPRVLAALAHGPDRLEGIVVDTGLDSGAP